MEEEDSPMTRHERILGSVVRAQKLAKRGRYKATAKESSGNAKRREWLDPSLTQRIVDDYMNSEGMRISLYFRDSLSFVLAPSVQVVARQFGITTHVP